MAIKPLKPKKIKGTSKKVLKIQRTAKPKEVHKGLRGSVNGEDLIIEDVTGAHVEDENLIFD